MGVIERKEREKEYRKMQILEAGEKLFLKKGFENVTMDDIAKECELSKGTLYLYYKSKDELFYTLILKGIEILISMFREGIKNAGNFQEKMNSLGVQYLKFYEQYPSYYKMVNYMGDHKSIKRDGLAELEKALIQKNNEIWKINVELFQEGIKRGIFKNDFDPFEFSITLWASSNGMIQVLEHMKSHAKNADKIDSDEFCFCSFNFEKTLNNLWNRLISTILVAPDKF
jgi:TetR/AcrR family transcriptional regulator